MNYRLTSFLKGSVSIKNGIKNLVKKALPGWLLTRVLYNKVAHLFLLRISTRGITPRTSLRFDIHVTDHCNLNCKGCSHFSSLAEDFFIDPASLERDCIRLAELSSGKVADICVLGGEPLLHPNITDILDIARKHFPIGRIFLVTNGILLNKQTEAFWESCIKNKIDIEISVYTLNIDFSEAKRMAKSHGIKLGLRGDPADRKRTWLYQPLDLQGKQNGIKSHRMCPFANFCIQIIDGKMYQCATVAFVKYFNNYFKQNLVVMEGDYIDIYKVKNIKEIYDFLCKPMPFCRYCRTKDVDFVEWGITKKEINEWV